MSCNCFLPVLLFVPVPVTMVCKNKQVATGAGLQTALQNSAAENNRLLLLNKFRIILPSSF